jgi:hypothetical protein
LPTTSDVAPGGEAGARALRAANRGEIAIITHYGIAFTIERDTLPLDRPFSPRAGRRDCAMLPEYFVQPGFDSVIKLALNHTKHFKPVGVAPLQLPAGPFWVLGPADLHSAVLVSYEINGHPDVLA